MRAGNYVVGLLVCFCVVLMLSRGTTATCTQKLHHLIDGQDSFQILDTIDGSVDNGDGYLLDSGKSAMRGRLLFVPRLPLYSPDNIDMQIVIYARPVGSAEFNAEPVDMIEIERKNNGRAIGIPMVTAWNQHMVVADSTYLHCFVRSAATLDASGFAESALYTHTHSLNIVDDYGAITGTEIVSNTMTVITNEGTTLVYLYNRATSRWQWASTAGTDCVRVPEDSGWNSDPAILQTARFISTAETRASSGTSLSMDKEAASSLFLYTDSIAETYSAEIDVDNNSTQYMTASIFYYTVGEPVPSSGTSDLVASLVERQVIQAPSNAHSIAVDPIHGRVAVGVSSRNTVHVFVPECYASDSDQHTTCSYGIGQTITSTSDGFGASVAFTGDQGRLVVGTYSDRTVDHVERACAPFQDTASYDRCITSPVSTLFVYKDVMGAPLLSSTRLVLEDHYSVANPRYDWPVGLWLVTDKSPFTSGDIVVTPYPSGSVGSYELNDGVLASVVVPMSDAGSSDSMCDTDLRFCTREHEACHRQASTPSCELNAMADLYLFQDRCDEAIGAYQSDY